MAIVCKDWGQDPAVWSGRTNLCLQCWGQGGNQWDSIPQGNTRPHFKASQRKSAELLAGASRGPAAATQPHLLDRDLPGWTLLLSSPEHTPGQAGHFFSPETCLKLWNCKIKIFEQGPNSTRGAAHLPHEVPLLFPGCFSRHSMHIGQTQCGN